MAKITPTVLLNAYASGLFPMAESATGKKLHWMSPDPRTILPLDVGFHAPRSLKKFLRKEPFAYTHNQAFSEVIAGCADRPETWINDEIIELFSELHQQGYAHSVEAWLNPSRHSRESGNPSTNEPSFPMDPRLHGDDVNFLVGGVYGIALGGAFFAESMFSRVNNASKACVAHLVQHLRAQGFVLCDVQYTNDHLLQFGVQEIAQTEYLQRLERALVLRCRF
jgi:leucyl/phenylalanyl-tRNA---protein transferase